MTGKKKNALLSQLHVAATAQILFRVLYKSSEKLFFFGLSKRSLNYFWWVPTYIYVLKGNCTNILHKWYEIWDMSVNYQALNKLLQPCETTDMCIFIAASNLMSSWWCKCEYNKLKTILMILLHALRKRQQLQSCKHPDLQDAGWAQ